MKKSFNSNKNNNIMLYFFIIREILRYYTIKICLNRKFLRISMIIEILLFFFLLYMKSN